MTHMKKHLFMIAAAVVVMGAHGAEAQDDWRKGLYIKGAGGWNHAQEQDYTGGETDFDNGYAVSGAVGYDYGDLRSELEITYRSNDVDSHTAAGAPLASPGGEINSTAFMLNGYYDMPLGGPVTPYIGAGIGLANVNVDGYSTGGVQLADEEDNVFAYQAMVGGEYAATDKVSVFTEYKYFATSDVDLGTGVDGNYDNHAIMAGLKYSLN